MQNRYENQIISNIEASIWPGDAYIYPRKFMYESMEIDFLEVWKNERKINIYIHIPFCVSKCAFCGFFALGMNQHKGKSMSSYIEKYTVALVDEIKYFATIMKDVEVCSIYFGGGTPNVLKIEQISKILSTIENHFFQSIDNINVCFEAHPNLLHSSYISGLSENMVNRISIGIQTFNEGELKNAERFNNFKKIYDTVEICHKYSMLFNVDLMIGLPNQDAKSIWFSIENTIKLEPQSITIYLLSIVKGTPLSRNDSIKALSMKEIYLLLPKIFEYMNANNYIQQSNVSFINKSFYNKNNSMYLKVGSVDPKIPTLGLGLGSRSFGSEIHYTTRYSSNQNEIISFVESYLEMNNKKLEYVGVRLSIDENKRRYVILNLADGGIDMLDYKNRFGSEILQDFQEEFSALNNLNMIIIADNQITLTTKGFVYSDVISAIFVSENINRKNTERKITSIL